MPEDKKTAKRAVAEPATPEEKEIEEKSKKSGKKPETFKPRLKPELSGQEKAALALRARKKSETPHFKRQEWFRYQKLGDSWRKPRGLHSKMRRHIKYRTNVVSIGYRGPASVRGRHPSGFEEVMVHNIADMDGLDPKKQAIRIGHSVGYLKRMHIAIKAEELNLRILNFSREVHEDLLAEAKKRDIELPSKKDPSKKAATKKKASKKRSASKEADSKGAPAEEAEQ